MIEGIKRGKKYGMIIDLHRCVVGCGACDLACKSENNTPVGIDWASHKVETYGIFPKLPIPIHQRCVTTVKMLHVLSLPTSSDA